MHIGTRKRLGEDSRSEDTPASSLNERTRGGIGGLARTPGGSVL
jgi:hypothetical protein